METAWCCWTRGAAWRKSCRLYKYLILYTVYLNAVSPVDHALEANALNAFLNGWQSHEKSILISSQFPDLQHILWYVLTLTVVHPGSNWVAKIQDPGDRGKPWQFGPTSRHCSVSSNLLLPSARHSNGAAEPFRTPLEAVSATVVRGIGRTRWMAKGY